MSCLNSIKFNYELCVMISMIPSPLFSNAYIEYVCVCVCVCDKNFNLSNSNCKTFVHSRIHLPIHCSQSKILFRFPKISFFVMPTRVQVLLFLRLSFAFKLVNLICVYRCESSSQRKGRKSKRQLCLAFFFFFFFFNFL